MNKLKVGDKAIYEGREVEITLIKDGYCVGWRSGNSGGLDHINLFSPLPIIAPNVQECDTTEVQSLDEPMAQKGASHHKGGKEI